jgi:hypothetical protein
MKTSIPDVLTSEEAETLTSRIGKFGNTDFTPIRKVLDSIKDAGIDFTLHHKSYWRVESRAAGHGWHVDTGNKNHMAWCTYGGSVLLTDPKDFTGGVLTYKDGVAPKEKLRLYIHSSDVEHMVTPHEGKRIVLLLFI